jgi:hypothetical protein
MPDMHTPWMMHDMEPMTVVTAKKPGKFIALFDGRSFDEETNERHARLAIRAVNRDHLFGELVGALEDIAAYWNGCKNQTAMSDACLHNVEIACVALAKLKDQSHG